MLKILYFYLQETKKKFGIYKVVNILKRQGKKHKVELSQNVFDIFF